MATEVRGGEPDPRFGITQKAINRMADELKKMYSEEHYKVSDGGFYGDATWLLVLAAKALAPASPVEGEGAREALERTRWILERALHAYDKTETTMDGLVELVVSVKEAHDIARAALASQATAQEKNDG